MSVEIAFWDFSEIEKAVVGYTHINLLPENKDGGGILLDEWRDNPGQEYWFYISFDMIEVYWSLFYGDLWLPEERDI